MARIVVGVDGSETSRAALAWALDEARRRSALVEVVRAWSVPANESFVPVPVEAFREAEDAAVGAMVTELLGEGAAPEVRRSTVYGAPGEVLVDAAEGADMVVVGSRGLGGFTGMLLGSVSQYVLHHASCPVVVVHDPDGGS